MALQSFCPLAWPKPFFFPWGRVEVQGVSSPHTFKMWVQPRWTLVNSVIISVLCRGTDRLHVLGANGIEN